MLQKYLKSVILLLAYIIHIVTAGKCFLDRDELKSAVDEFIDGDCGDSNNKLCDVTTYGYPMNSWCIGNVTSLRYLFSVKPTFNEDISGWDTSRVTSMEGTFSGASLFSGNQIGSWNVSSVTNMKEAFLAASSFDENLSQWDVSSVTTMREHTSLKAEDWKIGLHHLQPTWAKCLSYFIFGKHISLGSFWRIYLIPWR